MTRHMESSNLSFDDDDKLKIIDYCIDHIRNGNKNGNGYCSLDYAVQQSCPGKEFTDRRHRLSYLKSVSAKITESGEYKVSFDYGDGNVDIRKNPDYKRKKYFEKHPTQEKIFIAVASSVIGGCVTLAINNYNNRSQRKTDYIQDQQIKELKDSVSKPNLSAQATRPE
jgi:hypothetical protein